MKKYGLILLISFVLPPKVSFAQQPTFDASLKQLTNQLVLKLTAYHKKQIAVWDLTNLNGDVSPIGKYVAEDIAINLSDSFRITSRNQLSALMKENEIQSKASVDQKTFKQLKNIAGIDIIITGTATVLSNYMKISLQALDSTSGIIAATKGEVAINEDIKELLGLSNQSLNSNEHFNNPATVDVACKQKLTGDYCFMNSTSKLLEITISTKTGSKMTLNPSQSQCIYNLNGSTYNYSITEPGYAYNGISYEGTILVEVCKSKTFEIK